MSERYSRFIIDRVYGLWAFRIGLSYFKIKAPWCRPLFSERYGFETTIFSVGDWRLLIRKLPPATPENG